MYGGQTGLHARLFIALTFLVLPIARVSIAAPVTSSVTVGVSSADGNGSIARPYIALVRDDEPWRRPLREEVLQKGASRVWTVPPGRYRVVAGARGYATNYGNAVELRAGQSRSVIVALERLASLGGRIVDDGGNSVAGARVGLLHSFAIDSQLRLSAMGEEALAANVAATSGPDGRFLIPVHPRFGTPLYIAAAGFEPRFLSNVRLADGTDLGAIGLKRGAALTVTWSSDRAGSDDRLVLVPMRRALPDSLTREMLMSVWTRPSRGGRARWESLPAGEYELWMNGWRRDHTAPPLVLTKLTLAPGEATAAVTLPASDLAGGHGTPLRLLIEDFTAVTPPAVVRWLSGHAGAVVFRPENVSGGTAFEVSGGCRRGAVYVVDTGTMIGVTDPVLPAKCGDPLHVKLLPASTLAVELIPPSGSGAPPSGTLRLADCKRSSVRRIADVPFTIANGKAVIRVPSGCSVPVFAAGDFSGVSIPITPAPGKKVTLPAIRLERGAAILARVLSRDRLPLDDIGVTAVAADLWNALPPTESANALPALAGGITQNGGWVKLAAIPPNRDVVLMLRDAGRRYPVFTTVYRPAAGQPLLLDPLEMPPPASLTVRLAMPKELTEHGVSVLAVDATAAEGTPWPRHQFLHAPVSNGTATFEEIPPGKWRIRADGRLEGSTLSELGVVAADVPPGSDVAVDLPIRSLLYHGVVTLRGDAVRGDLTLRPERGSPSQVRLGDDGKFAVILPQAGLYKAELRQRPADGNLPYITIPRVDFSTSDREVAIALPEGRISGRIVDANGNGVANATVAATGTHIAESVTFVEGGTHSAVDGGFALDALSEGTWAVEAHLGKRRTDAVETTVSANQNIDGVKLTLSDVVKVTGQITTATGAPADGATIVLDRLGDDGFAGPLFARSGADGQFSFDVQASLLGQRVDLKFRTRDGSVGAQRLTLAEPLLPQVPPTGVVKLATAQPLNRTLMAMFVADDGSALNALFCRPQVTESAEGSTAIVPSLAAGHWRYIEARSAPDVLRMIRGEAAMLPALASFSVHPGITAEIDVRDKSARATP